MSQKVGSHLMWPQHLVITKNEKETASLSKNPPTFSSATYERVPVALRCLVKLVEHMGSPIQITTLVEVFRVRRKCYVMIESSRDFSSMQPTCTACLDTYMMYLYIIIDEGKSLNLYKFLDARTVSFSSYKELRAQLLNARLLGAKYDQLVLFSYNSGAAIRSLLNHPQVCRSRNAQLFGILPWFGRIYSTVKPTMEQWIDIGLFVWLVEKSWFQCIDVRLIGT
ncbi:uncharacterized protein LOC116404967 [Cucumis sativus]|uniref:uncharacterized protein LOC116404967 n=1 Tax=Cucumis sativus TaxID=3659 RepID=UPI0012F50A82|nr:uncharacterized protein LOC116404967 [Cucumis sativus]